MDALVLAQQLTVLPVPALISGYIRETHDAYIAPRDPCGLAFLVLLSVMLCDSHVMFARFLYALE